MVSPFQLCSMKSNFTEVISPNKGMREENVCLKVLVVVVDITTSISQQSNHNGDSQKGNRAYFHCNKIFLLLKKTMVNFHPSMTLIKIILYENI